MKEPVLQDKRQEHLKFCRYANDLIERVSGKHQNANIDASLDRIRKADVVAQTKIVYQEKELLQLIHDHLMAKGKSHISLIARNAILVLQYFDSKCFVDFSKKSNRKMALLKSLILEIQKRVIVRHYT